MINKKRERTQSPNKVAEEEINNNTIIKKRMPFNEAKKEMKDFKLLIDNTEKEIQKKYGIIFPDLSFEDNLPDEIKNKLIDYFLEKPDIKKILNEVNSQK
jgi:flagellar biosynthesis component FlhA